MAVSSLWRRHPRLISATGSLLAAICVVAGLGLYDYAHIGIIPNPCAAHADWHADAALVLSGAPRLRRTRQAVAAYDAGHVPLVAFSGAGYGGDSAHNLARGAEQQLKLSPGAVVIEDQARSTADNFRFSCRLPALADARTIAVATDGPHMWRSLQTAAAQCPQRQFCALPAPVKLTARRHSGETLKLLVYQLTGRARWF